MITVSDVSVRFSEKPLFKDVNLKFTNGNCYGITGANGAGKSTFLKVLSGDLEHDSGTITMSTGERMAVLKQDHFAYDEYSVKDTVMMGFPKLYELSHAIEDIYAKEDFSDEDGMKAAEMQGEFGEIGGYEAENQIEQMLSGLGLEEEYHSQNASRHDGSVRCAGHGMCRGMPGLESQKGTGAAGRKTSFYENVRADFQTRKPPEWAVFYQFGR